MSATHQPNNTIRRAGMLIFLAAFVYLCLLPFTTKYSIMDKTMEDAFGSAETVALINEAAPDFANSVTHGKFAFMNRLAELDEQCSALARAQNGFSDEEIAAIVAATSANENTYAVETAIGALAEVTEAKRKALQDYTSWMEGKTFDDGSFEGTFRAKADEINANISGLGLSADDKLHVVRKASQSPAKNNRPLTLLLTFGLGILGALIHILPKRTELPGIKHNNIFKDPLNSRGWIGILLGTFMIVFYIVLYWFPAYIAEWTLLMDPIAKPLSGGNAGRWFLYGALYTIAVVVMGIRYLIKYRHSRYQQIRTFSVMFFQISFAFILSNLLSKNGLPGADLKNIWPLDYSFFFDYRIKGMIEAGTFGFWMLGWGVALILIGVPVITYFFGKRWYCSWVCGCGGLAETAGDPFRQQSDKSLSAWKIERYLIHAVLVFAVVMTVSVLYTTWNDVRLNKAGSYLMGVNSYEVRQWYGFFISSIFAGVVGTGFYPLMGSRVWCRFGCPLAAYLGMVQRFKSRFRITTNGGQCISCGNCSTYCEMGIDVRWYAQRGQNIVRSSCVGCGVCSAVCPRGVLNLENGPDVGRTEIQTIHISRDEVKVLG